MAGDAERLNPLVFDTELLPPNARFEAWRSALGGIDTAYAVDLPFQARASLWMLGSLVLTHADVAPLRYERTEAAIRHDLKDHLAVVVLAQGEFAGGYGAGETRSGPGSVTVIDMLRPWWTEATRLEAFVLSLPRAFLVPLLDECDPHGMVATGPLADLLTAFLRSVAALLPEMTRGHAPAVADRVRDLLADTILDAHRSRGAGRTRDDALVSRVRAHIDDHLAAQIDVAAICAALSVSRSTLYRAFGGGGGVLQQVQRRRLHALRALLSDPGETRSIADLALSVGFPDRSHLTRLFKREYGLTPGEFRSGGAQIGPDVSVERIPAVFERWTALLD